MPSGLHVYTEGRCREKDFFIDDKDMFKRCKSSALRVYIVPEEAKVEEIQKVVPTTALNSAIIKNKAGIDIQITDNHTYITYLIFTDETGKKLPFMGYIRKGKNYLNPSADINFGDKYINDECENMIDAMLDEIPKYKSVYKAKCSDSVKDMLKQKIQQLGEKLDQERTKLDEEEKRQLEQEQENKRLKMERMNKIKQEQERNRLDRERKKQKNQEQKMGVILRDGCEKVYGIKISTEKSKLMAAAIKEFLDKTKGLAESSMSEPNRKTGQEEGR